jgi:hypothetical protein
MSSDPDDRRRAMLGLAAVLTIAAGAVAVGVSLQRRERELRVATTTTPPTPTMIPSTLEPAVAPVTARMAAADRRPLRVLEVSLVADPADYTGRCPTTIRFQGTIRVQGHGRVSYSFPRSDGGRGPAETIEVDSASPAAVETYWMLGRQPANPHEGWQALQIVAPQPMTSERAAFRITCVP